MRKIQAPVPARIDNAHGGLVADARDSEQGFKRSSVDLCRKVFQMPKRPFTFWIQLGIEIGTFRTQKFFRVKAIKAKQPVSLIKAVFPKKGTAASGGGRRLSSLTGI